MIRLKAKNEAEAKAEAIEISLDNRGKYVVIGAVFGLIASLSSRLNVFSPSDSAFTWYVLNGSVKTFSAKQRIADQNSTPKMS